METAQGVAMTKDQRYSREDALESRAFLQLYLGALKIEDDKQRVRTVTVILLAGRLGLRASEIQHLHEGWINWERGTIRVPAHDPCFCKWCIESARGKIASKRGVDKKDIDRDDPDVLEYVYENQYQPKPGASARVVPFGWSERITAWLLHYFKNNEYIDVSQQQLRNDVRKAAEFAEGIDQSNLTLHPLRATAATFNADAGLLAKPLRDLMGWSGRAQANRYVRGSGRQLTSKVYEIFGKGEWAPEAIPEDPGEIFPVACNPQPFASETDIDPYKGNPTARKERAEQLDEKKEPLYNPRRERRFDGIPYEPDRHSIPGHIDPDSPRLEDVDVERVGIDADLREWVGYQNEQADPVGDDVDRRTGLSDYTHDDKATAEPLTALVAARLSYECENVKESQNVGYQGPRRTAAAAGGMLFWSASFGTISAHDGILADIYTGEPTAVASVVIAGVIVLPYLVWSTHELTHDEPKAVEPQTQFDRVILTTHSIVDSVIHRTRSSYKTAIKLLTR